MKKDILIDLDEKFSKSTINESIAVPGRVPDEVIARINLVEKFHLPQSKVDVMTSTEVLQEYNTQLTSQINSLPDLDAILQEWSWRCNKGYPDYSDKEDRFKLQEVLDEMGINLPFKRISEAPGDKKSTTKTTKKTVKPSANQKSNKVSKPTINSSEVKKYYSGSNANILSIVTKMLDANLRDLVYVRMVEKLKTLPKDKIAKIDKELRTYSLKEFLSKGWKTFEDFFMVKIERFGAGELMCVMAIKNSRSGGVNEKDLTIDGANGGYFEVKEGPDQIQMAGSGASGKFPYVRKMVQFYQLLDDLNLRDRSNDQILKKQLDNLFKSETISNTIYNVLANNFRGDSDKSEGNYFAKFESLNELPGGMIQKHLDGFRILKSARATIKSNKDVMSSSKIQVSTPDADDSYYITTADAEKIRNAKSDSDVKIHKGAAVNVTTKNISNILLSILKFEYSITPDNLVKDIAIVKSNYFNEMDGLVWYEKAEKNNAQPHLGYNKDFVIQGISLNMGKMRRADKATWEFEKLQKNY